MEQSCTIGFPGTGTSTACSTRPSTPTTTYSMTFGRAQ